MGSPQMKTRPQGKIGPLTPRQAPLHPTCLPISAPSKLVAITATARSLTAASIAPATRRAYAGQVARFDAWLKREGRTAGDAAIADYLTEMHTGGASPASAGQTVAGIRWEQTDAAAAVARLQPDC